MGRGIAGLTSIKVLRADQQAVTSNIVLTSGTASKGAWVELTASTSFQVNYLVAGIDNENTSNEYHIDIGTGAAGSEVVLLPDIHHHINLTGQNIITLHIPYKVEIPKGTRLAARVAATNNTDTIEFNLHCSGTD